MTETEMTERVARAMYDAQHMTVVTLMLPTRDQVETDFAMSLGTFMYVEGMLGKRNLRICNERSCYIDSNRNVIAKNAVALGDDYVFAIDSDMMFPPDALERLLAADKDIVGATYARRQPPHRLIGAAKDRVKSLTPDGGLQEMIRLPTGMLLIKTKVFKALPYPWFKISYLEDGSTQGEDINFCILAIEHGFDIWCDPKLTSELGHVGRKVYRSTSQAAD